MSIRLTALLGGFLAAGAMSFAVGVADPGTFKTNDGDRVPAEVFDNVRIIPPPPGGRLNVRVRADRPRYHTGDTVTITFGVNRDSYVYIFNTDAAGRTNQIFPNYFDRSNFLRAGKSYYIPDRGYDLEVVGPRGNNVITAVAVERDYPFLQEFHTYTRRDPYPAYRDGAVALVRRIEQFRTEPSAMTVAPLRPAPREDLWATDDTTLYVMDSPSYPQKEYQVARFGAMSINSYPTNARIYIGGEYYGRTPQVVDRLEVGYHNLRLTKEGLEPYECEVYVEGHKTKEIDLFLQYTPLQPGYSRSSKPSQGWWNALDPLNGK